MIFGVLIAHKKYAVQKYFIVLTIVIGIGVFIYRDKSQMKNGKSNFIGLILLAISLVSEGIKSSIFDLKQKVFKSTALNFMYRENFWSLLFSLLVLSVTDEGNEFCYFVIRHPSVLIHLGVIFVCSLGQFLIASMIFHYGSLPFALISTFRKFLTVLFSILIFKNSLTYSQIIATGVIFFALILDVLFGKENLMNVSENEEKSSSFGFEERIEFTEGDFECKLTKTQDKNKISNV